MGVGVHNVAGNAEHFVISGEIGSERSNQFSATFEQPKPFGLPLSVSKLKAFHSYIFKLIFKGHSDCKNLGKFVFKYLQVSRIIYIHNLCLICIICFLIDKYKSVTAYFE